MKLAKKLMIPFICIVGVLFLAGVTNLDTLVLKYNLVVGTDAVIGTDVVIGDDVTIGGDVDITGSMIIPTITSASGALPALVDPSLYFGVQEDFIGSPTIVKDTVSELMGDSIRTGWVMKFGLDTIFTTKVIRDDSVGGLLKIALLQTDNDSTILYIKGDAFHADTIGGKDLWFEARFSVPDTTEFEMMFGLGAAPEANGLDPNDFIGFAMYDANNILKAMQVINGSFDSTTAVANMAAATFYTYKIHVNGLGTTTFYVDGTLVATLTAYTPWDEDLTPFIMFKQGDGVGSRNYAYIDYIKVVQEK